MPTFTTAQAFNADYLSKLTRVPVIVITGGTSGIGAAIATSFAEYTGGKAHIVLVGRNHAAADILLASFPKPLESTGWKHEFVQCDLSLMSETQKVTKDLASRLPEINFLCLCAGFISWLGRDETSEGLDRRLAIRYYARWIFVRNLLPSIRRAKDAGEPRGVLSVMGSAATGWPSVDKDGNTHGTSMFMKVLTMLRGEVPKVNINDIGFSKNPTAFKTSSAAGTYNDLMLDTFAAQEPGISFTHCFPGFVATPTAVVKLPHWYQKPLEWLYAFMQKLLNKQPSECAEYMLYALFDAEEGSSSRNQTGDLTRRASEKGPSADPVRDKEALWEHTVVATRSD